MKKMSAINYLCAIGNTENAGTFRTPGTNIEEFLYLIFGECISHYGRLDVNKDCLYIYDNPIFRVSPEEYLTTEDGREIFIYELE